MRQYSAGRPNFPFAALLQEAQTLMEAHRLTRGTFVCAANSTIGHGLPQKDLCNSLLADEEEIMTEQAKKILVVDDEEDILMYLATLFEDHGFQTVSAQDGEKAYEAAVAEKPDLITLDLAMPEQSGVKTYRNCKYSAETQEVPVIVITGVGENMEEYFKKMPNFPTPEGFVNKPIDPEELMAQVHALLEKV